MASAPPERDRGKLLIVDDLPENLALLTEMLVERGYEVRRAPGGTLALKSIPRFQPDVILLDIMMPDLDGFEVCRRLQAAEETRSIPVIFLSALDEPFDKVKAFSVGGADYITKPFQVEEVVARVEHQMRIRHLQEEVKRQNQQLRAEVLERERAEAALRVKAEREQAVSDLIQAMRSSLESAIAFEAVVTKLGAILAADFVGVLRYQPYDPRWQFVGEYIRNAEFRAAIAPLGESQLPGYFCRLNDVCRDSWEPLIHDRDLVGVVPYAGSWLLVPIRADEKVWGTLCLLREQTRPWKEEERQLVTTIAHQLAIAIYQLELYQQLQQANQQLERMVKIDGLTGVANRRHFDEALQSEWVKLQRGQFPLSLILCDVDFFKRYNDYYGHPAGDRCLVQIARAMSRVVMRSVDLVARYGGEELAVILPNTDIEGALIVATRIHSEIRQLKIPHERSPISELVTVSLGISSLDTKSDVSPEELVASADEALYEAKSQGRNCTATRVANGELQWQVLR